MQLQYGRIKYACCVNRLGFKPPPSEVGRSTVGFSLPPANECISQSQVVIASGSGLIPKEI
jgi:hypothetical protein